MITAMRWLPAAVLFALTIHTNIAVGHSKRKILSRLHSRRHLPNDELHNNFIEFPNERRVCVPAYGSDNPTVDKNATKFEANLTVFSDTAKAVPLAYAIYLFEDEKLFGSSIPGQPDYQLLCKKGSGKDVCPHTGRGFIFNGTKETMVTDTLLVVSGGVSTLSLHGLKTGLYCISWVDNQASGSGVILVSTHVHSIVGHLPAEHYPLYIWSAVALGIYSVIFLIWCIKLLIHWGQILPVQKFISGVFAFLILEAFVSFFFLYSWTQASPPSLRLLMLSAITTTARLSLSYFLLLIICTGYSVVKPSLGSQMTRCQILTLLHFIFHSIYTTLSLKNTQLGFLMAVAVTVPLWLTMTIFYMVTLTSLAETTQYLQARQQHAKLLMFTRLWKIILFAAVNFILFFIASSLWFVLRRRNMAFYSHWWQWQWLLNTGWMSFLYWTCFLVIAYLWRPTKNNARYGLEEVMSSDPLEADFDFGEGGPQMFNDIHAMSVSDIGSLGLGGTGRGRSTAAADATTIEDGEIENNSAVFTLHDSDDEDYTDAEESNRVGVTPRRHRSPVQRRE